MLWVSYGCIIFYLITTKTMKTFFSKLKKQEIKNKFQAVCIRFLISILVSIIVTIVFFTLIAGWFSGETERLFVRIIMASIVVFFLSISTTLCGESLKNKKYISLWYIVSLVFWWLFFYFLSANIENFENIIFFILTLLGIISFLFFAPYTKHLKNTSYKEISYYIYFYSIAVIFFISFIVGWSLTLLGNVAIWSVRTLFDLNYSFSGDIHAYWSSFALAFLTPIFILYQIPSKENFEENTFHENIFFNFLIRYIAIPFIYVYFFILYAYILKVLVNFGDWPKGEVSWMVIGFSLFGYITYIFSYIFECEKTQWYHKLITLFRQYFPYIVLPPVAMLFYAIFVRIWQYDLTINRYFVVAFGVYLTVSSLYLILSQKKSLLYIPALLTLFTLIMSVGPWSAYHLPLSRQTERLEDNLITANILYNTGFSPREILPLGEYDDITPQLSGEIYEGIRYVCGFDNCNKIKQLFPKIYADILRDDERTFNTNKEKYNWFNEDKYTWPNRFKIISELTDRLMVQAYDAWRIYEGFSTFHTYANDIFYPLDVRGYDYVMQVRQANNQATDAFVNMKEQTLTIQIKELSEEIDISHIIDSLWGHHHHTSDHHDTSGDHNSWEDTSFEIEGKLFWWIFYIENAQISKDSHIELKEYEREYINGTLLLQIK
jgi:hypothetical protein